MHLAYVPLLLGRGERLWEAWTRLRPDMKLRSSWELRRHFTSALCERTPQTAFGMGGSRNDVIIGTSKSARFTTVTWEVPGRMAS